MYRIFHNQTVAGAILIDDIDDGLPNKVVHRLGATGNPDAYERDGYANKPKQACYVPRTQASTGFPLVQGYINLKQTPRVTLSAGKGKISKLRAAGLITVVSLAPEDVAPPGLETAVLAGTLTLTGTTLLSVAPDVTSVMITGTGAVTLLGTVITAGGGTISGTTITIPAALIPGVVATASSVKVIANQQSTAVVPVTV